MSVATNATDDGGETDQGHRGRWRLPEIITMVVSAVVVIGFAGVALRLESQALSPAQPVLAVSLDRDEAAPASGMGHPVPFTVTNTGSAGATQVTIRLTQSGESPETVDLVLDVLPAGSSVSGVALFAADPAAAEVTAAVTSFLEP